MAKEDPEEKKQRAHEAWKVAHDKEMRELTQARRNLCTGLRFRDVCGDARCKRAGRCAGNADACFLRFWRHVPEKIKNTIRHMIKLVSEGMPKSEAIRKAEAYAEECERMDEELARRWPAMHAGGAPSEAQAEAAPVTRAQPPVMSGPRIRSL
jgi:hypothetical protein